ncbi:MAG: hypothetical protein WCI29_12760 [Actinomycetes bacterium]
MARIRWPWCEDCGEPTPRSGRSRYCDKCRRERRRAAQNQAQRDRRVAATLDPDTAALLTEIDIAARDLDTYLKTALMRATAKGADLTGPQKQALRLLAASTSLADQVRNRGLRPPPRNN